MQKHPFWAPPSGPSCCPVFSSYWRVLGVLKQEVDKGGWDPKMKTFWEERIGKHLSELAGMSSEAWCRPRRPTWGHVPVRSLHLLSVPREQLAGSLREPLSLGPDTLGLSDLMSPDIPPIFEPRYPSPSHPPRSPPPPPKKEICSISSRSRVLAHRPCPKLSLEMFCPSVLQLFYGCSKVLMTNHGTDEFFFFFFFFKPAGDQSSATLVPDHNMIYKLPFPLNWSVSLTRT